MNDLCTLCPINCTIDRQIQIGACGVGNFGVQQDDTSHIARVALHMWEEPIISGTHGSGTIFFCGCNMRCLFCQNYEISTDSDFGTIATSSDLVQHMLLLQSNGAHNINLVSPTPHVPNIIHSVNSARENGLNIPIVYNTNAYMNIETVDMLRDTVDIFMPDFKYVSSELSLRYSGVKDYFKYASEAIDRMLTLRGNIQVDEQGMAKSGVIIRHLVLPANIDETRHVLDFIKEAYSCNVTISLMSQYFPAHKALTTPPLDRKLLRREYNRAVDYALSLGFINIWTQSVKSADSGYVPPWNEYILG